MEATINISASRQSALRLTCVTKIKTANMLHTWHIMWHFNFDNEVTRVWTPVLCRRQSTGTGNTYIVIVHWEIYFFSLFHCIMPLIQFILCPCQYQYDVTRSRICIYELLFQVRVMVRGLG